MSGNSNSNSNAIPYHNPTNSNSDSNRMPKTFIQDKIRQVNAQRLHKRCRRIRLGDTDQSATWMYFLVWNKWNCLSGSQHLHTAKQLLWQSLHSSVSNYRIQMQVRHLNIHICFMMIKLDSQPFRSRANSHPGANRPIEPWPIRSRELSLPALFAPGPLAPWNLRSRALLLPGLLATRLIE